MIFHKIWIFVDVNGLQSQLAQPFSPISVAFRGGGDPTTPRLAPSSVLEIHLCRVVKYSKYSNSGRSKHCRDPSQAPVELKSSLLLKVQQHFRKNILYPAWNDLHVKPRILSELFVSVSITCLLNIGTVNSLSNIIPVSTVTLVAAGGLVSLQ